MKRKSFCLITLLFMGLWFTACDSDDANSLYMPATGEAQDYELSSEWNTGRRVFCFNPWEKPIVIPISKEHNPEFKYSGKYFNWEIKQGVEDNYLVLTLKKGVERKSFMEKIPTRWITTRGASSSDTLYIISQPKVKSAEVPNYQRSLGKTINVTEDFYALPDETFLDFDLMWADGSIELSEQVETTAKTKEGLSFEEMKYSMWQELGIDVSLSDGSSSFTQKFRKLFHADPKRCFSASFDEKFNKNTARSNKYEYEISHYTKKVVDMHLASNIYDSPEADDFLQYANKRYIDMLNTPSHKDYQAYSNDYEGISALYDTYGTHVLLGGVFGGNFTYIFSRKANCYFEELSTSISIDLNTSLSENQTPGENWMRTYINATNTQGGNLNIGGGDVKSNYSEYVQSESTFHVTGGTGEVNFEKWDASVTCKEDNLALISFGGRGKNSSQFYLLPLYRLAKDSARHKAMEEYLNRYVEEREQKVASPKLVVADFMMKTVKNNHKEKVHYKIMEDAEKQKRVYFPLVANEYVPNSSGGFMLDVSSDDYIVTSDEADQLFWVSLDFADECKPITHLCFLTKEENNKLPAQKRYVLRGENAQTKMNWPDIDDHYVGIRRAANVGDTEGAITGVGLSRRSDDYEYYVIASSPGTDMLAPYSEYEMQAQFRRYWGDKAKYTFSKIPYKIGVKDGGSSWKEADGWFGNHSAAQQRNWIMPAYTTKDIEFPLVYTKTKKNYEKPKEY